MNRTGIVSAAVVGVVATGTARRLLEVRQTRRGDAAPLGPATRTVTGRQGPLASRVDTWTPAPPRSQAGRIAAAAWAAPLTTFGALLAAAGLAWRRRSAASVPQIERPTVGTAGPSGPVPMSAAVSYTHLTLPTIYSV